MSVGLTRGRLPLSARRKDLELLRRQSGYGRYTPQARVAIRPTGFERDRDRVKTPRMSPGSGSESGLLPVSSSNPYPHPLFLLSFVQQWTVVKS